VNNTVEPTMGGSKKNQKRLLGRWKIGSRSRSWRKTNKGKKRRRILQKWKIVNRRSQKKRIRGRIRCVGDKARIRIREGEVPIPGQWSIWRLYAE